MVVVDYIHASYRQSDMRQQVRYVDWSPCKIKMTNLTIGSTWGYQTPVADWSSNYWVEQTSLEGMEAELD